MTPTLLEKVDSRMKMIKLPSGYGTLPSAISTAFHSMKSDEYKTWVLFISLFALRGILPKPQFNMWQMFVRACKILLKGYISPDELTTAHNLLKLFNTTFQSILGSQHCTPNMHMALHIKGCISDFGPVYGFWCYSFERYNGILGNYQTNNKSITVQLMKKFLNHRHTINAYEKISSEIPSLAELGLLSKKNDNFKNSMPLHSFRISNEIDPSLLLQASVSFLSVGRLQCLTKEDVDNLNLFIKNLFSSSDVEVSHIVRSFLRIQVGRFFISSSQYRANDNSNKYVMVSDQSEKRPGVVRNIIDVTVKIDGCAYQIPFLEVNIFKKHQFQDFYGVFSPMKLFDTSFEAELFVPAIAVISKLVVIKAENKFIRLPLANNRVSKHKASDVVNFVFEILF